MSSGQVTFFRSKDDIRAEEREEKDGGEDVKEEKEEDDDDDSSSTPSSTSSEEEKTRKRLGPTTKEDQKRSIHHHRCQLRNVLRNLDRYRVGKRKFCSYLILAHINLDELDESRHWVSNWIELADLLKAILKQAEKALRKAEEKSRDTILSSLNRLQVRLESCFQDPLLQSRLYKAGLPSDQARAFNICNQLQRQMTRERGPQPKSAQKSPHLWSSVERCLRTSIEARSLDSRITIICMGIEPRLDNCTTIAEKDDGRASLPLYEPEGLKDLNWTGVYSLTICGSDLTWYMCLSALPFCQQQIRRVHLNTHVNGYKAPNEPLELPPNVACSPSIKEITIDLFRFSDSGDLHQGVCARNVKNFLQDKGCSSLGSTSLAPLGAHCVVVPMQSVPFATWIGEVFQAQPPHFRALADQTYVCVSCQRVVSFADEDEAAKALVKYGKAPTIANNPQPSTKGVRASSVRRNVPPLQSTHNLPPLSEELSFGIWQKRFLREEDLQDGERKEMRIEKPAIHIGGRGRWLVGNPSQWVDWRFCRQCIIAHLCIKVDDEQDQLSKCRCIVCETREERLKANVVIEGLSASDSDSD